MGQSIVIVNPNAAGGRLGRRWPQLEPIVRRIPGDLEIAFTEREGHASELAAGAIARGIRDIYSVGGDGTNNEVINGIMRHPDSARDVRVGLLPYGTGGDFRRILHDGDDLEATVRGFTEREPVAIDLGYVSYRGDDGLVQERYFLNMASFGLGGLVDRIVNRSPKWMGGKASFYLGTVRALLRYKPTHCRLIADGEDRGIFHVSNVFVGNAPYAGGGMYLTPEARLDDGWLDVVVVPDLPVLRALKSMPMLYKGTHVELPEVESFRVRELRAEALSDEMGLVDIDGEAPGRIPLIMRIVPAALQMRNVVPSVLSSAVDQREASPGGR